MAHTQLSLKMCLANLVSGERNMKLWKAYSLLWIGKAEEIEKCVEDFKKNKQMIQAVKQSSGKM